MACYAAIPLASVEGFLCCFGPYQAIFVYSRGKKKDPGSQDPDLFHLCAIQVDYSLTRALQSTLFKNPGGVP